MGDRTGIQWTDATWNPLRGCSRVSEGCRHCYAELLAARFSKPGLWAHGFAEMTDAGPRWTGRVELLPSRLDLPLRWKEPRRIFVSSTSDVFHEKLADEDIDRIFAVMALAPQHTFQVLTKRPDRMSTYLSCGGARARVVGMMMACVAHHNLKAGRDPVPTGVRLDAWPLPNVWLGVSVEDQATADARIPLLLQTPAAVRFVSYEPALGPVDFAAAEVGVAADSPRLDWIIVGGESGPGARPFDVAWARSTIEQCRAAGVACFVKQLGARPVYAEHPEDWEPMEGVRNLLANDRKGGDPSEWPEDLKCREFPR